MKISKYLDLRRIYFLDAMQRDEVIRYMSQQLALNHTIPDADVFMKAILERERIVSTGIGMGVAIPHAKLHEFDDFFIAIAILKQGVDWDAIDGAPVRLIFMIGGPDDKQTEYLQILSRLTQVIRDEDRRKKMLTSDSAKQILEMYDTF